MTGLILMMERLAFYMGFQEDILANGFNIKETINPIQ
jgi:hypothetical protein